MNASFKNVSATKLTATFCIPQRIWYHNALNLAKISKTAGFLRHMLTSREVELSLPNSQEFVWILLVMFEPERLTLIFLTIDAKQGLIGALCVKVSFSDGDFSIIMLRRFYERNQNVRN